MSKKILQISNDFSDQKIYINLVRNLSEAGYEQVVYVPVKGEDKINGNRDDSINRVEYLYSFILKKNFFFRLKYHKKINLILKDIEAKINLKEIDLVHSHFLFSDGGVAYLLKKKYNIPYIVNVRASDIFTFFNKMKHLKRFGNDIMNEAEKVVFINHSYKDIFREKYLTKNFTDFTNKTIIIPNAIDDKWFHSQPEIKTIRKEVKLLYVGRIIKRKKLDIVIKALIKLNKSSLRHEFFLDVVGIGNYFDKVKNISKSNVTFLGIINNHLELLEIYKKSHIFVMPSIKETFGLVYIEALSQGLPIIYCENEGVDGFFKNGEVGYSVRANSIEDVFKKIIKIEDDYERLSERAKALSKNFNWKEITNKYVNIYEGII